MPIINRQKTEKLLSVVDSVKKNWATSKTVWKAAARWKGGFWVEAESWGLKLRADEPEMLVGTNTAETPLRWCFRLMARAFPSAMPWNAAVWGSGSKNFGLM